MAAGELESSLDFDAYWKAWLASRLAEIEERARARRQQELQEQQQQQQQLEQPGQEMEEEEEEERKNNSAIFRSQDHELWSLPGALFMQLLLLCDQRQLQQQPLCNAFGVLFLVAYAAAATVAILVTMAYIRKKRSDRALR